MKQGDDTLWRISAPELVNNSYIVYEITGRDKLGPFEGERRYNHFNALRNCLSQNYPGILVPGIPPKKAVGNKDIEFVIERRYFLERFFMQLSQRHYLHDAIEMKIFARPEIIGGNNDVDKQLSKLQRPGLDEILKFYIKIFELSEKDVEEAKAVVTESIKKLEETQVWLKKLMTQYNALKKQVFGMIQVKNNQNEYQRQIVQVLSRYEEKSAELYKDVCS